MKANLFAGLMQRHALFSMFMLYAGKTSGILVNLVFLPIYSNTLGPDQFGIVAVILSLQSLLLMLDLGLSTIIGRDIAANEGTPSQLLHQVFSAELGLIVLYSGLLLLVGASTFTTFQFGVSPVIPPVLVVMFMTLVLQNLHYSAIIARRAYTAASALQLTGNLVRAGGTAATLAYASPTLEAFVASQLIGALLQLIAARYLCIHEFKKDPRYSNHDIQTPLRQSSYALLRKARPIALLSVSGAAVMQLDKPIISFFMEPSSVAPYFLAMTYCMVPMAVLAGPVSQYFQPIVINAVAADEQKRAFVVMRMYTAALVSITFLPSLVMYLFRDFLVGLWLHNGPLVNSTLDYIQILLPGLTIGALGFLPNSLLLVVRDYKFMAILSTMMTVVTLIAATYGASQGSIWLVCVVYATYHAASTILQWVRAFARSAVEILAFASAKWVFWSLSLLALILIIDKLIK